MRHILRPCIILAMFASAPAFVGCSSWTTFKSIPPGAKLFVDGQYRGITPCEYSDSKLSGSVSYFRLTLDGFQDFNGTIIKNERANFRAILGGVLLVPLFWCTEYNSERTYNLLERSETPTAGASERTDLKPRLAELKKMLDAGTITFDEYAKLRNKAIENSN